MHGGEMLIPILVPLGAFAMIFGIFYIKSRENLAMIEKGMNPKLDRPAPYKNLKWGLLLIGAGVGLFLAYMLDRFMLRDWDNPAIYFALIGIGGGLGLVGSYRVEKKELLDKLNS
ncbi:MAG TPA: DUF6249 domain-containing protein [Puia sp.]|nr:DUF6249 domain-containing protein [Puia sp.]